MTRRMGPRLRGDDLWLTPGPDVEHIAVPSAEIVDPAQRRIRVDRLAFAIDRNQCCLDVRLHLAAVATDINDGAVFDQAPDPILLYRDQVLHIGLGAFGARESGIELGDAVGREGLELVGVEIILIGMTAAEKQQRRAERCTLGLARGPLLQEAAERRQTWSRSD